MKTMMMTMALLVLASVTTAQAGEGTAVDMKHARVSTPNAKVEIIEFSDFQCPFCSRVLPTLSELRKAYGDQVRVVFLNQPLPFHQNAMPAAIAAEAARNQGKFWPMHDKLFANQQALESEDFERYAGELGLDLERFKKDLADPATLARVTAHSNIGSAVGAVGTPSFFINGVSLRGAQPIEAFRELIDDEIADANEAKAKGDKWIQSRLKAANEELYDYVYGGKAPPPKAPTPAPRVDKTVYKVVVDPAVDAWKGEADALVTLVVFADFQCPFCKKLNPTLDQLMTDYAGKVRLVFKHATLPFHRDATPAAYAAICAQQQGAFWQMHDLLFEQQQQLQPEDLEARAEELGLDMRTFRSCSATAESKLKPRIDADLELATMVTARGTPNTFINGRKLTGARPIEEFKTIIDEELKSAELLARARGLKGQALYAEIIKDGKVFMPLEERVNAFKVGPKTAIEGKPNAKVVVTVFADYQCPFSARLVWPLHDLKAKYGNDLAVVFRHFPLSFHNEAMGAATAAICAGEQGKFWPYHDAVYAAQKNLSPETLVAIANDLALDQPKFVACVAEGRDAPIERDLADGKDAGVSGTPTIFINGRKFNSPSGYNVDAFSAVIDKYILKTPQP